MFDYVDQYDGYRGQINLEAETYIPELDDEPAPVVAEYEFRGAPETEDSEPLPF